MPNNDYKILWDVNWNDWREIKKRFQDKLPPDDDKFRINHHLNINFPILSLLINLNKRIEELEYQLKELTRKCDKENK